MLPTLVVVSGPPGSGKTTLAHLLARRIGCPAVSRDEIKEGMVHATPGFVPSDGDPLTMRTLPTFFGVLELLLRAGVTTVAEAAFQDRIWRPHLLPLLDLASVRVVHCAVAPDVAVDRGNRRNEADPLRGAHAPITPGPFDRVRLEGVPALEVDTTTADYEPALPEIVAWLHRAV